MVVVFYSRSVVCKVFGLFVIESGFLCPGKSWLRAIDLL